MKVPETARPVQFQDLQFVRGDLGGAACALTLVPPFVQQGGSGTGPTETHPRLEDNRAWGPASWRTAFLGGERRDL